MVNVHMIEYGNHAGEPYIALNEAFIVYADFENVIAALRTLHKGSPFPEDKRRFLSNVVREMGKAARVNVKNFSDAGFLNHFKP